MESETKKLAIKDCPRCEGQGEVVHIVTYEGPWMIECEMCNGSGVVKARQASISCKGGEYGKSFLQ